MAEKATIPDYETHSIVCHCGCGCNNPNPTFPGSSLCPSCAEGSCKKLLRRRAAWLVFECAKLPLFTGFSSFVQYALRNEFMAIWLSLPISKEE